ncbi:nucleotide-diphospho-sugar transferase, partial [Amylostereum chailletii]
MGHAGILEHRAYDTVPDSYYDLSEVDGALVKSHTRPLSPDPPSTLLTRKANATMVMLARNSDLDGVIRSVKDAEDRFNRRAGYPWVFLNEEPFSDEFKRRISNIIRSPVQFGLVPRDHWVQPDWIDEDRASAARNKMVEDNIIYGGARASPRSMRYRNMCRFNSGFFYRHPLLQQYRYYWRVEQALPPLSSRASRLNAPIGRPDVHFHCDMRFDPFLYMQDHNKTYGFTITMYEFEATIPTLWSAVREFVKKYPEHVAKDNALDFISDDDGQHFNRCHFWSNFEIADMDFWRGEAYAAFFDHLDQK